MTLPGAPWEPTLTFARAVLAPASPHGMGTHETAVLALGAALLVLLAIKAFRDVGLTPFETLSLLVAAPLLAGVETTLWQPRPTTTLAMNLAGCFIPAAVCLKLLVEGRAPFVASMLALGIATFVSYASSYAVPSEGVLLYYRVPALAAGVAALVLARGAWHRVGPIAYVAGAGGVIIGADVLRIHELMVSTHPHRIIVGGAGVLDGIFLVGLLAVVLGAFGAACASAARQYIAPEPQRAREATGSE